MFYMKRFFILTLALMTCAVALADKPHLDHSVYDGWKNVGRLSNPEGGEWTTYVINPQEGDGMLYFYNTRTGTRWEVERGDAPRFTADLSKAVFRIAPLFQETRQARIDKKKGDAMPKDSLGLIDLATGEITRWPMLKALKVPDNFTGKMAFAEVVRDEPAKKPAAKPEKEKAEKSEKSETAETPKAKEEKPAPKPKDNLYVLDVNTLAIDTLRCVENFWYSGDGSRMAFITKPGKKDSTTVRAMWIYDFATGSSTQVLAGEKESWFGNAEFNDNADKLVFYAALDTVKDARKHPDLYIYDGECKVLVAKDDKVLPEGWQISSRGSLQFRGADNYLLFSICPVPREKDTTKVDFEQPSLDIWSWNDEYIQPTQKVNNRPETYTARVNLADGSTVRLGDETVPTVTVGRHNTLDSIIVYSNKPYRIRRTWDVNPAVDVYVLDLTTGEKRMIMQEARLSRSSTSVDGAYTVFYNAQDRNWYQYTLASGEMVNLTGELGVTFWNEDHDTPNMPSSYSNALWMEDCTSFIIRDRYDWWMFDATRAKAPYVLTQGKGRENDTYFDYINVYNDTFQARKIRRGIPTDRPLWFKTFNYTTKETGLARLDLKARKPMVEKLVEGPYRYDSFILTGGRRPVLLYARGCFEDGNNLWMTRDLFKSQLQLTDANPQQREYNWGTVELMNWTTEDGIRAEGLLFKPENFDPAKKYPVIFYFYEKNSHTLYNPRVPSPSRSTVNIPYFVSNEYLIFVPDMYYKDGHPGQSALKCLMPACDMLCQLPWVDGDNLAIQGQSWGGYQVAYLITQTNRFKAAGAGAPVSNMTSAYGGVRWESGLLRTMQYEMGQSRIGKDLWDGFDLYIENSPLFFVPNVTTPVLIMHNDADGAVPWWQGIEFYSALRRCGKEAWLLQYNNEEHNLRERRNCKDLSIRLAQFFGYYLKGEPMPIWMSRGIPYELKGIEYGYGYEEN